MPTRRPPGEFPHLLTPRLWLALCGLALAGCMCVGGTEVRVGDLVFCAQVAETAAARAAGLRGADPLLAGEGLLLAFPIEGEVCIVNDGVSFAIDVLYADDSGRVVAIERAVPAGDATPRCHAPVRDVLEVRATELDAVEIGDELGWR